MSEPPALRVVRWTGRGTSGSVQGMDGETPTHAQDWQPSFKGQRPPFGKGNTEGHKAKGKPKSLRRLARALAFQANPEDEDGYTRGQRVVEALVTKAETGDVPAIKLLADLVDPPRAKHVEHRHTLARTLIIAPDDDVRALPADAQVQLPSGEPPDIP